MIEKKSKISWLLTVDFDDCTHLFKESDTGYKVDCYECSCGYTETIIRRSDQITSFTCIKCDNDTFYNANLAERNIEFFLSLYNNLPFEYHFEFTEDFDLATIIRTKKMIKSIII